MHLRFKSGQDKQGADISVANGNSAPKLAKHSMHRKSTIISGRTIGAKRERLETANERAAARKKDKQKSAFRLFSTIVCFFTLAGVLFIVYSSFTKQKNDDTELPDSGISSSEEPTIEIVDEDANVTGGKITSRMNEYIGRVEECFNEKGYRPQKALIPSSGIREVRVYLEGFEGFIKMIVDRDPAVSVEDADRMIRYLRELGVEDFKYIDVRIDGKAYWK